VVVIMYKVSGLLRGNNPETFICSFPFIEHIVSTRTMVAEHLY
jgi:hypothetical protein